MTDMKRTSFSRARDDFARARRRAALTQALANLTGQSTDLLNFDEVRQQLKFTGSSPAGTEDVPLRAIVGSVGRYQDFTRSFLPTNPSDEMRWAGLRAYIEDGGRMAPIEVYKMGDAYFVIDGNHRVSIARQLGFEFISAYVIEIKTRVAFSQGDTPDKIICKARYAEFLEQTNLDDLRPDCDLQMTFCDQFDLLLSQIEVQRYFLWRDHGEEYAYPQVVEHWYDRVYLPVIEVIREGGLPQAFPERTETDLYILLTEHRQDLEKQLGWQVHSQDVAVDMEREKRRGPVTQLGRVLLGAFLPGALQSSPQTGQWRQERLAARRSPRLFVDILAAGRGLEADWTMLDHALLIAKRERARLLGLRVVPEETAETLPEMQAMQTEFDRRCQVAGVWGSVTFERGAVVESIVSRAVWADLVALTLVRSEKSQTRLSFGSHFDQILQLSSRPVLAVPEGAASRLDRLLLAYDGSPKADEALFAAAYLAEAWSAPLAVLSSGTEAPARAALDRARLYLAERGVAAQVVYRLEPAAEAILDEAGRQGSNLIVMGGYGSHALSRLLVGSTVHAVLRQTSIPVLVCR